jgi:hypothetical protein
LLRYFGMQHRRTTRAMNASAAHRKVSYGDRNAVVGYGRNDYQNSALSELCGSASAANSTI